MTTDLEYIETACNAFACGEKPRHPGWHTMPPEARLAHAKTLHAELLANKSPEAERFRRQNGRLFRELDHGLTMLRKSSVFSVVFWVPVLHVGGADQWVVSLCKHFDRRKVRPVAVCVRDPHQIDPMMVARLPSGVPLLIGEPSLVPAAEFADTVISWGLPDLPKLAKALPSGKPVIHVLHHPPEFQRPDLLFKREAGIRQVAVCPGFAEQVGIECVENGAEVDRVLPLGDRDMERERLGVPPGGKVILYVGRFSKEKNVPGLIAAFRTLPEDYTLVLAGPHVHRPSDINVTHRRIICHPAVDGLHGLMAAADCLVLPSNYESHGLALTEAWLAGVPTVSCSYPVNLAFEKRFGRLSWLVPVQPFPGHLAGAILEACAGSGDARIERARKAANGIYTAELMTRRWEGLLTSVPAAAAST